MTMSRSSRSAREPGYTFDPACDALPRLAGAFLRRAVAPGARLPACVTATP
jgi:hypothetical protein